jgi:hypothetical protein
MTEESVSDFLSALMTRLVCLSEQNERVGGKVLREISSTTATGSNGLFQFMPVRYALEDFQSPVEDEME